VALIGCVKAKAVVRSMGFFSAGKAKKHSLPKLKDGSVFGRPCGGAAQKRGPSLKKDVPADGPA
jgi:hypothetical protein